MGSPCPPHWTFAARAAYFGERLCAFCDHRNPAGARFCNDCGSPLDLKPCRECDGVNDESASHCHQCGAACPLVDAAPAATGTFAAADTSSGPPVTGAGPVAGTATRAVIGPFAMQAGWRSLTFAGLLATSVAMALIVAAYETYRDNPRQPGHLDVASARVVDVVNEASRATLADAAWPKSRPVDPEEVAAVEVRMPAAQEETPQRAVGRRVPPPVPARVHANVYQRAAAERQVAVRKPASVSYRAAPAGAATRVAQTSKARQSDRWQAMHASLAKCGGDVLARIACDHRVRRHFCEGYWGVASECPSGITNEHGQ